MIRGSARRLLPYFWRQHLFLFSLDARHPAERLNDFKLSNQRRCDMSAPKRVSAEVVRNKLQSGEALLVCAYESDTKFRDTALDGAISFSEFERRKASLPRDVELVFY
jgi:hypothetical protein